MRRAAYVPLMAIIIISTAFTQDLDNDISSMPLEDLLNFKISTAAKYEQTSAEAPASVTIITSDEIERYGYQTLTDVLNNVRGFYVSNDRNYDYVGIRGFSHPSDYNNGIQLLINGHTINENFYGAAAIGTDLGLDLNVVDHIEIVRGPGSVLYGTGAMFSVINVITKKGAQVDGLKVTGKTGSYGTLSGAVLYGKKFENGFQALISTNWTDIRGQDLYFSEYDDPLTNNGVAEKLDWDTNYGFLTSFDYNDFSFQSKYVFREKGVPTAAYDSDFNDSRLRTIDEQVFFEFKYNTKIGADKNVMARGYFDRYHYKGYFPYLGDMFWDKTDGNWAGGEFQFEWDLMANNRLTIGSEYIKHFQADYKYWDDYDVYFDEDYPYSVFSFYVQNEYQIIENLALTAGLRRDDCSKDHPSITPRGALVYHPFNKTSIKVLYGEAFRIPNKYETYYEDAFSDWKASSNLHAEQIAAEEIVWEQVLTDQFFSVVSFYHYRIKDLIDTKIDPADDFLVFANIDEVRATGIEFELRAELRNGTSGYISYNFQRAKNIMTDLRLSNSPDYLFKLGVSYPVTPFLRASTNLNYESERTTVYGTRTDSFILSNGALTFNPWFVTDSPAGQFMSGLKVSLAVRNLLNESYATPGGFEHYQAEFEQNGRNYLVTMEYEF